MATGDKLINLDGLKSVHESIVGLTGPAYDDTSTYAVGEYAVFGGKLYRCIKAITTAETFDSTKWTQVTSISEIARIHDDNWHLGCTNYLSTVEMSDISNYRGISINWRGNIGYVSGTATQSMVGIIVDCKSALPTGMSVGSSYMLRCSGTNVKFRLAAYDSNGESLGVRVNDAQTNTTFTLPANAVGFVLSVVVSSGTVVNETIYVAITDASTMTNKELSDSIATIMATL